MENELGLAAHYLIGMALGAGYMGLPRAFGARPDIETAWAYGTATTVLPWFVTYPRMGWDCLGGWGDKRLLGASLGGYALFGLCLGVATAAMRGRTVRQA